MHHLSGHSLLFKVREGAVLLWLLQSCVCVCLGLAERAPSLEKSILGTSVTHQMDSCNNSEACLHWAMAQVCRAESLLLGAGVILRDFTHGWLSSDGAA